MDKNKGTTIPKVLLAKRIWRIFDSSSTKDVVKGYISTQNEHHKKKSFKDEYLAFLKEYNINYDERYVWD